ncbi:hypothetical protein K505DRAFT_232070 [Melanomma pulvis-pyrius CBS 109.77]|uniref:Uncharacterized protein n=1 Tax=Melanomma pulvis-pyrius CBS 109.77 TaxID=1314802 RepID=A0A6A6XRY6_9PLEO|nr:hypothetical protein K505DRAFT_232070 [Melanomma pulvis-pyrius CBS 109.77]
MANPLPSFQVVLNPEGDGGHFRYENAPGEIQRPHLVDRGNSLVIQGELVEVVHGTLSPNGDHGTIIVTDFLFLPSKNSRRFKYAAITLRFESEDPSASEVEVIDISPKGHQSMLPTNKTVELTRSANASVTGGTVVSAGAGLAWEPKESQDKTFETVLAGTIRLEGRAFGGKNTARWTTSENPEAESGIPTLLRTVTLLKRKEKREGGNMRFKAAVEIRCKVDFVSSLGEGRNSLLGRIPKDDPVIFDPKEPPTTTVFGTEELRAQNLAQHSAVVSTTMLSNTVQGRIVHVSC